jgi:hypothetical protein
MGGEAVPGNHPRVWVCVDAVGQPGGFEPRSREGHSRRGGFLELFSQQNVDEGLGRYTLALGHLDNLTH